ncbi:ferritin-like domain-containing protein [Marinobacterium jannaschii]|uniref:ferritin-like domain-containing protein n=1 Tax=Marinobacterium jannaschii TaxID=64970 RepID=UPI000687700B|nr:ferritin-like domain-containing protein [Marinobacterium jannaschii]
MDYQQIADLRLQEQPTLKNRPLSDKPADINAVRQLCQAAVNVELFTIPLYMTAMYSIQGMHEINTKHGFYKGRQWPGMATTSGSGETPNETCFNIIFSVFIQEMLHLQLAANISTALSKGVDRDKVRYFPTFTSPLLQGSFDDQGTSYPDAWICYGKNCTSIPHIVDFNDTTLEGLTVELGPLDAQRITLFKAIEEPEADACAIIRDSAKDKYFPAVPFAGWTEGSSEADLPLFGTISYMYQCLATYLNISYDDGSTLFEAVYTDKSAQQDLFNLEDAKGGHPCQEFPRMGGLKVTSSNLSEAKEQIFNLMSGITDQGEGGKLDVIPEPVPQPLQATLLGAVDCEYQPDFAALTEDYPSYDQNGNKLPQSSDAHARYTWGDKDHYERFQIVEELMARPEFSTWQQWHAQGNRWSAEDLKTADYEVQENIPDPADIAAAMNRLKETDMSQNYLSFSHVAAGSIAGITTVLNDYWDYNDYFSDNPTAFPYPSMGGSGDRIAICWALFGLTPELDKGAYPRQPGGAQGPGKVPANHACQGMSFDINSWQESCATQGVYHTCKGSNGCAGEGGCGYVHDAYSGGNCSHSGGGSGTDSVFSAPADNQCGGKGGCAVPISASQLLPEGGNMQLFNLKSDAENNYDKLAVMPFTEGEPVYDVAWRAYTEVLKAQGVEPLPEKPAPSDLRLVFPPST